MIHHELASKDLKSYMNDLIRGNRIQDFDNIPTSDKQYLMYLAYSADETWAYECLIENDNFHAIKNAIARSLKYQDGSFDKMLGEIIREVIPDYFDSAVREIFDGLVIDWKTAVHDDAGYTE